MGRCGGTACNMLSRWRLLLCYTTCPKDLCCVYPYLCDIRLVVDAAPITIALARRGHAAATRSAIANSSNSNDTNNKQQQWGRRHEHGVRLHALVLLPAVHRSQATLLCRRAEPSLWCPVGNCCSTASISPAPKWQPCAPSAHTLVCSKACAVLRTRLSGSALGAPRCIPVRFTLVARRLQVAALAISSGAIELANSRIGISVRSTCAAALAPAVATAGSCCRGPCWTPTAAAAAR